jgi:hypothetical protein
MVPFREDRPAVRELLPWVPTLLAICALIALLIVTATRFSSSPEAAPPPPAPTFLPVPPLGLTPGTEAPVPILTTTTPNPPSPARSRPRTIPATDPPETDPPRPPPSDVTGRYRVVDSFPDGFIGEVLVRNTSGRDRDWRVELRFPDDGGDLVTSWVESAPQATLSRAGDRFVWSSGVPVAARGSVALRFQFSGTRDRPASCTVNRTACTGTQ